VICSWATCLIFGRTCTAQSCSESFTAMFRWCCDHLYQLIFAAFLTWWWSQHHWNVAVKILNNFEQCMSEYRAGAITNHSYLKLYKTHRPTWPSLTLMLSMPNTPKWLSSSLAVSELCLTLRRGEKESSRTTKSGLNVTEPLKVVGKVWFIRLFSMGYISTTMVTTWYFANSPCQSVFIWTTQFH